MKKSMVIMICLLTAGITLNAQAKTQKPAKAQPAVPAVPPAPRQAEVPPPPPPPPVEPSPAKASKHKKVNVSDNKNAAIKSIHIKDDRWVTIVGKDGVKDSYDLTVEAEAKAMKDKYGELPSTPAPPPPPPAPAED